MIDREEIEAARAANRARYERSTADRGGESSTGMITARVDPAVKQLLKRIAVNEGKQYSDIVRQAIDEFLERKAREVE